MKHYMSIGLLLCTMSLIGWHGALVSAVDEPETVLATFMRSPAPRAARHRADERGDKTALVDIFTWRDGSSPDHVPAAIPAIWTEMARLTEPRGGNPAIDIVQVSLVR